MKRFGIWLLAAALCLTGCGQSKESSVQIFAMDTVMELSASGAQASAALEQAEQSIRALEDTLSRTLPESAVSRLNASGTLQDVPADCFALIRRALEYRDATGGAFDITIAPVMDAWGFSGGDYRVPDASELAALLPRVNSDLITLSDVPERTVTLGEGQSIDLGGIAKGYTSDCVEEIFRIAGLTSGKISLGGNVFVLGSKADGSAWRVGIRDPRDVGALTVILPLRDAYAITSGGYERYFESDGVTYHHIIDPATGAPAESGLLSVTVVAPANGAASAPDVPGNGTMCDAFSTALFVMGEEKALDFWRSSGYDFDLVLVTADNRVVITAGLAEDFESAESSGYTYETVS